MNTESTLTTIGVARATRKEWIALAVLAFPTLLVSMDSTVTFLALPAISAALKPTGSQLLWITDMYSFIEAGFLIIMGAMGDRVGRKRMLIIGFIGFALSSIMAAYASSAFMLIAARAFLGISGAIILPCTLSLIRSMFVDAQQRTMAFGIYTTCYAGGTMLGPLLGGILLTHFWWGSVFLISVPLMLFFLAASPLLREYRDTEATQFSVWSAVMLLAGVLPVVYGVKHIAESGTVEGLAMTAIVVGIIISAAFIYLQNVVSNPLIDLKLFRIPIFSATLTMLFISLFCWLGLYLFVAQYLQLVLGFNVMKAGLLTLLPAALSMAGCMLSPQLLKWMSRTAIIVLGSIVMLTGMMLAAQLTEFSHLLLVILAGTGLSMGCGFIVTIGIDLVVSSAPHEQSGAAAGISETSTTFGSAFGVALLGSIGTAVYHSKMEMTRISGALVSDEAMNTLGGALVAADQLEGTSRAVLIETARSAFMDSFHSASYLAAVVLFIAVVIFSAVVVSRKSA